MKQHQDYDSSISLGLRPREAAKALGIGERLLWSKTNAGEIPHLRVGRAIIYPVDLLRDWMAEQASKSTKSRISYSTASPMSVSTTCGCSNRGTGTTSVPWRQPRSTTS